MAVVIKSEYISKKYIISHQQKEKYVTLRDVIAKKATALFQSSDKSVNGETGAVATSEDIWALRDINFERQEGDRVWIIGRNGAGKSTLLKVLSRITEPTKGKISIKGCVSSLLEVGTGFHAELTGRENIFLNGAILGMHRAEIK